MKPNPLIMPFLKATIEVGVRCAFWLHRQILTHWERCEDEEREARLAALSPAQVSKMAIDEVLTERRAHRRPGAVGFGIPYEAQTKARLEKPEKENSHAE